MSEPGPKTPAAAAEEPAGALVPQGPLGTLLPALRSFADLIEEEERLGFVGRLRRTARRRARLLTLLAALGLAVAAVEAFSATPLYRAAATVQVDPELTEGGAEGAPDGGGGEVTAKYLATQAENLKSRAVAREVVDELDLAADPAFARPLSRGLLRDLLAAGAARLRALRAATPGGEDGVPGAAAPEPAPPPERAAVERLRSLLAVRPVAGTRHVEVAFRAPDAALAARVANAVSEAFVTGHLAAKFEASQRATAYLRERIAESAAALEAAEDELLAWGERRESADATGDLERAQQELAALAADRAAAERERIAAEARFEAVKDIPPGSLPDDLAAERVRSLAAELTRLETRLAGLAQRYGPRWPEVEKTRQESQRLQSELEAARQAAIDGVAERYLEARQRVAGLGAAIERRRAAAAAGEGAAIEHGRLRRDVETGRQLHASLMDRLRASGSTTGLRATNVRVVDEAVAPAAPTRPRRVLVLAVGLLAGLGLGLAVVAAEAARDTRVRAGDDFRDLLRLPLLATLPPIGRHAKRRLWPRRLPAGPPELAWVEVGDENEAAMGAFRELAATLQLATPERPPETILFTGVEAGDGASTAAVNTAIALAEAGARTVLLDLNLRRPVLGELLGHPETKGVTSFLSGTSDLASEILETGFPGLFVVPAGPAPPDPAVLIASERMQMGLELLREYFTHVVIDAPPSLVYADALLLSARVEGVVLVVRDRSTSRHAARRVRNLFVRVGAHLFGVVVNRDRRRRRTAA